MVQRSSRNHLVVQTQEEGPQRNAFCGLYSINNALQIRDFLTPKSMLKYLARLKKQFPDEDHGHIRYGAYSIKALQQALQARQYNLVYINKLKTWKKATIAERHKRIATTTFPRVIIIGEPPEQKSGISHCIARVVRAVQKGDKKKEKPLLICPDYGEVKDCSEGSLTAFLPTLQGAYAILSHVELRDRKRANLIPEDALVE